MRNATKAIFFLNSKSRNCQILILSQDSCSSHRNIPTELNMNLFEDQGPSAPRWRHWVRRCWFPEAAQAADQCTGKTDSSDLRYYWTYC